MQTLDLRKLVNGDVDNWKIGIRLERKLSGYNELRLRMPGSDKFVHIDISKSLRYKCHSPEFSWGYDGEAPKQMALAICLELYPVSVALKLYKKFMFDHIVPIAQQTRLYMADLFVPINPSLDGLL